MFQGNIFLVPFPNLKFKKPKTDNCKYVIDYQQYCVLKIQKVGLQRLLWIDITEKQKEQSREQMDRK